MTIVFKSVLKQTIIYEFILKGIVFRKFVIDEHTLVRYTAQHKGKLFSQNRGYVFAYMILQLI